MRRYIKVYLWVFFILLFITMTVFFIFKEDTALRDDIYDEAVEIDTILEIPIEQ